MSKLPHNDTENRRRLYDQLLEELVAKLRQSAVHKKEVDIGGEHRAFEAAIERKEAAIQKFKAADIGVEANRGRVEANTAQETHTDAGYSGFAGIDLESILGSGPEVTGFLSPCELFDQSYRQRLWRICKQSIGIISVILGAGLIFIIIFWNYTPFTS